jgi:hypothetical protein
MTNVLRESTENPDVPASARVLRKWFNRYTDTAGALVTGDRGDLPSLLEFYAVPLTIVTDDDHLVLPDSAAVLRAMRSTVDTLRDAGYVRTLTHRLDVHVLNERSAIVEGVFSRVTATGAVLARFGAVEVLVRTAIGWRISVMAMTAETGVDFSAPRTP